MAEYNPKGNLFGFNKVVGAQGIGPQRALVVDVNDPLKSHRVKVRIVGHMDDESSIPDEQLPWVGSRTGVDSPAMGGLTNTPGLLPGSMVNVDPMGTNGQDFLITGSLPNNQTGGNQSKNPAAVGEDKVHTDEDRKQGKFAHKKTLREIVATKTTRDAKELRDQNERTTNKTAEPIQESQEKSETPDQYGGRKNMKDGGDSSKTIGNDKFDGSPDAQSFIQSTINNGSAVMKNALSSIQQLKQLGGEQNPPAQESIGMENYQQLISQISALFGGGGGSSPPPPPPPPPANNQPNTVYDPIQDLTRQIGELNDLLIGDTVLLPHDEQLERGEVCYLTANGVMRKAQANGTSKAPGYGMCFTSTLTSNGFTTFMLRGRVFVEEWTFPTGSRMYLSPNTPGGITNVIPTAPGTIAQVVGIITANDTIDFNPSFNYTVNF